LASLSTHPDRAAGRVGSNGQPFPAITTRDHRSDGPQHQP
jgi:hypothetical protein